MPSQGHKTIAHVGRQPNSYLKIFVLLYVWCVYMIIATLMIVFLCFNQCLFQLKPLGLIWKIVELIWCKNRNFCVQCRISLILLEHLFDLNFLHNIVIQIYQVVLSFQNFRSYKSTMFVHILQTVPFQTDSVFACIVCLV